MSEIQIIFSSQVVIPNTKSKMFPVLEMLVLHIAHCFTYYI